MKDIATFSVGQAVLTCLLESGAFTLCAVRGQDTSWNGLTIPVWLSIPTVAGSSLEPSRLYRDLLRLRWPFSQGLLELLEPLLQIAPDARLPAALRGRIRC
jgi:hypothetical protein